MKIDEGCIEHNALLMIEHAIGDCPAFDFCNVDGGTDTKELNSVIALGNIFGIILMANQMKQVLKV